MQTAAHKISNRVTKAIHNSSKKVKSGNNPILGCHTKSGAFFVTFLAKQKSKYKTAILSKTNLKTSFSPSSEASYIKETDTYIQETNTYIQEITAYIKETASRNKEISIYIKEMPSYIKEMNTHNEETVIYTEEMAAYIKEKAICRKETSNYSKEKVIYKKEINYYTKTTGNNNISITNSWKENNNCPRYPEFVTQNIYFCMPLT